MGRLELVEKLDRFLRIHNDFKEECEVIYLMVELRKLLDRDREQYKLNNYSLVRFHADWIVHTRKDFITPTIKKILSDFDKSIDIYYQKDGNADFLLMPEFRKELLRLLESNSLPNHFCKDDIKWRSFILILTQVLADQPLINPTDMIKEFWYVDMKGKGVMANIIFKGSKSGGGIIFGIGK